MNLLKLLFYIWIVAFFSSAFAKGDNYINYHKQILKAQLFYINGNLDSCMIVYANTFEQYPKSFPRDNFVAAQIAATENKELNCYSFLERAMKNGVILHTIEKSKVFDTFLNSSLGLKLKAKSDSLHFLFLQKIDTLNYRKCSELAKLDQKNIRVQYTFIGRLFTRHSEKKYYQINQPVFDSLRQIINKYGYLGALKIGIGQDSAFKPLIGNRNLSDHFLSSILYHYPNSAAEFGRKLYLEVENGNLHPIYYAMIIDYSDKYSGNSDRQALYPYGLVFTNKYQKTSVQDNNRNNIGLLSTADTKKLKILGIEKGIDFYLNPFR